MTFITPTIPADANPGPLVYTELATAMLADGWTLEDTVVISTRTHKVLKSAAAGNSYGLDWYLDISYPTTGIATGVLITPFEGYNSTTHVATRGPYSANSATLDATTYSRFGATTSALETNWANAGTYTALDSPLSVSAFGLWASVTRDRVILMLGTEPTEASYAGFFTPTAEHASHAGAAMFPLVVTRLSGFGNKTSSSAGVTSVQAALTRLPKVSAIADWGNHCIVGPDGPRMRGRVGGAASSFDNQITATPYLVGGGGSAWSASGAAVHVGELDGVQCAYADPAVTRGDTVTVSGDSFITSTVNSNACILIEAV